MTMKHRGEYNDSVSGSGLTGGLRVYRQAKPGKPLVSIITVSLNAEKSIESTVNSVVSQSYDYIEYIVIDGGSTDGTLSILYRHDCDINYWVSQEDKGIYDAMNKGVASCHGDWILFLGADDVLAGEDVVSTAVGELNVYRNFHGEYPTLLYGNVLYDNGVFFKSRVSVLLLLHNTVHHQAAIYRADLFKEFTYDTSHRAISDYELNLLIYNKKLPTLYLDKVVCRCSHGGASSNLKNRTKTIRELNAIRKKHLPKAVNLILTAFILCKTFVRTKLL